jgi:hypothetical protein
MLILMPLWILLGLHIGAGLIHLALKLLGAAHYPYEATLRVVAYGMGSTYPLMIVPLVGGLLASVWLLVVEIIGVMRVQETTAAEAAAAALIPILFCCCLFAVVFATVLASIIGVASGAAWR